jgi:4a-hydroxytetrahydrobiopterin dehydratase
MIKKKFYSTLSKHKAEKALNLMKATLKKTISESPSFRKAFKSIQKKGWKVEGKSIVKTYTTKNFPQTMALVSGISGLCQQYDHHPDYLTMKYAEVKVSFSTHDAGGITEKDVKIAGDIEKL